MYQEAYIRTNGYNIIFGGLVYKWTCDRRFDTKTDNNNNCLCLCVIIVYKCKGYFLLSLFKETIIYNQHICFIIFNKKLKLK